MLSERLLENKRSPIILSCLYSPVVFDRRAAIGLLTFLQKSVFTSVIIDGRRRRTNNKRRRFAVQLFRLSPSEDSDNDDNNNSVPNPTIEF